jgi:predicted outer membrane protein
MLDAMLHRMIRGLTIAALPLMLMASDNATISARDDAFIHQVMNGCTSEIMAAEAALKSSLTDIEREFARKVISNHLTLQRVLGTIAKNKHLAAKDEVQADEHEHIVTASQLTGRLFNTFFLRREITNDIADIALFEVEIRDGTDEDLKLFANTYLPSLQKSLLIAKEFGSHY